jgi:hypothetical protein
VSSEVHADFPPHHDEACGRSIEASRGWLQRAPSVQCSVFQRPDGPLDARNDRCAGNRLAPPRKGRPCWLAADRPGQKGRCAEPWRVQPRTEHPTGGAGCLARGPVFDNLASCLRRTDFPVRLVSAIAPGRVKVRRAGKPVLRRTEERRGILDRSRSRGRPGKAVDLAKLSPYVF